MSAANQHPPHQGQQIVTALGGRWNGHSGLCRCPAHDDRSPSLSVRLGDRSLLFNCFAGCTRASVISALRRHGLLGGRLATSAEPITAARPRTNQDDAALVQWIWRRTLPLAGTLAERYLESRGIARRSGELRFQPDARIGRGGSAWQGPALIAAVRDNRGLVAVQRTFLAPDGRAKAPVAQPRRMLGEPGHGAVRLATPTTVLGLAEGIETALSASALLGIPVWAALGTWRLGTIEIPGTVRQLVLLADPDRAGRTAAASATATLARPGLAINVRWPEPGAGDWNDVATRGEGARRR